MRYFFVPFRTSPRENSFSRSQSDDESNNAVTCVIPLFAQMNPVPSIRRQSASEFRWPPDPHEGFCYNLLSPQALADAASEETGTTVTVAEVCSFFLERKPAAMPRAYREYVTRWAADLEAGRSSRSS